MQQDVYFVILTSKTITQVYNFLKFLDADTKTIQQIEFVGQFKKLNNDGNATKAFHQENLFVLKNKETRLKFYQGSVAVL